MPSQFHTQNECHSSLNARNERILSEEEEHHDNEKFRLPLRPSLRMRECAWGPRLHEMCRPFKKCCQPSTPPNDKDQRLNIVYSHHTMPFGCRHDILGNKRISVLAPSNTSFGTDDLKALVYCLCLTLLLTFVFKVLFHCRFLKFRRHLFYGVPERCPRHRTFMYHHIFKDLGLMQTACLFEHPAVAFLNRVSCITPEKN